MSFDFLYRHSWFLPAMHGFLVPAAFFISSCESKTPAQAPPKKQSVAAAAAPVVRQQCFEWKEKNSRAIAKLTIRDDSVSGTLDYLFSEKDNSHGQLRGIMRGDTLFADYRFRSEGRTSVMEVAFLKQGAILIQGHGPMRLQGSKMVYAAPNRLQFVTGFKGIICN